MNARLKNESSEKCVRKRGAEREKEGGAYKLKGCLLEHRKLRRVMMRILVIVVFVVVSAVGLWYMHGLHEETINQERTDVLQTDTLQWDIPMTENNVCTLPIINVKLGNYVITCGIAIENGCATPIDVENYHQLFEKKMIERGKIYSGKRRFQEIDGMTVSLSEKETRRITAVFDRAATIYIANATSFQKGILMNSYHIIDNTMKYMEGELLEQKILSYTNPHPMNAEGMKPSGQYRYSAIVFIPKELTCHEFYTDEQGQKKMQTKTYPIIDSSGYASGAFFLVETDALEDLPD